MYHTTDRPDPQIPDKSFLHTKQFYDVLIAHHYLPTRYLHYIGCNFTIINAIVNEP